MGTFLTCDNIMIDLDEVRMVSGPYVLFTGSDRLFDIGDENANAVRKSLKPSSREQPPADQPD